MSVGVFKREPGERMSITEWARRCHELRAKHYRCEWYANDPGDSADPGVPSEWIIESEDGVIQSSYEPEPALEAFAAHVGKTRW